MELTNEVTVNAAPEAVFALVNDVQRVASCMPGAQLEGREGEDWHGRVKVKVGPITAAYTGTVRFLEVDQEQLRLRVQAHGADTHGSGDAEAEVRLDVVPAAEGAALRLHTDLVIRGKIAQFGKGAIVTVSNKLLQQFAQNLGNLLDQDRARDAESIGATHTTGAAAAPAPAPGPRPGVAAPAAAPVTAPTSGTDQGELDGLAMLLGPSAAKYAPVVGAFAVGVLEGWVLTRAFGRGRRRCPVRDCR